VAIGDPNLASGTGAVAMGANNTATGQGAVALGDSATANIAGSVALGTGSVTTRAAGMYTDPITGNSFTTAPGAISAGTSGSTRQITNVAPGTQSTDAVNLSQLQAVETTAAGAATTIANIENGAGIKYFHANSSLPDSTASGTNAVAVGPTSIAYGDGSVAQGYGAVAGASGSASTVTNDVALGTSASATGGSSLALGAGSIATRPAGTYTDPITGGSFTTTQGAVSVGTSGSTSQITNVAPGTQSTDAVNLSQLQAVATTVNSAETAVKNIENGGGIKYFHANSTLVDSTASGTNAVAVGPTATAYGDGSIAQGYGAVSGASGSASTVTNDIAIGTLASATVGSSTALGASSSVTTAGGVAVGAGSVSDRAAYGLDHRQQLHDGAGRGIGRHVELAATSHERCSGYAIYRRSEPQPARGSDELLDDLDRGSVVFDFKYIRFGRFDNDIVQQHESVCCRQCEQLHRAERNRGGCNCGGQRQHRIGYHQHDGRHGEQGDRCE